MSNKLQGLQDWGVKNKDTIIQILIILAAIIVLIVILRLTIYKKPSTTIQKVNEKYSSGGISSDQLDPPHQQVVTYMVWFFVKDWTTSARKNLFSDGNCTYAFLDKTINTLYVVPRFSNASGPTADWWAEAISVENVALQSWNCLTVMQRGRIFDVYMNGKLVRSHVTHQPSMPRFPTDARYFKWGKGATGTSEIEQDASGNESQAGVYFARIYVMNELTPQQVYSWYKDGPGTGKGQVESTGLSPLARISGTIFPSGHYEWVPDDDDSTD